MMMMTSKYKQLQREPVIASNTRRCHAISSDAIMLLQELLFHQIHKMQRDGQEDQIRHPIFKIQVRVHKKDNKEQ